MPRLFSAAHFDGAQYDPAPAGKKRTVPRLTLWERIPVGGPRASRVLEGDEALEGRTEIMDMLAGQSDDGEAVARQTPPRKAKRRSNEPST